MIGQLLPEDDIQVKLPKISPKSTPIQIVHFGIGTCRIAALNLLKRLFSFTSIRRLFSFTSVLGDVRLWVGVPRVSAALVVPLPVSPSTSCMGCLHNVAAMSC